MAWWDKETPEETERKKQEKARELEIQSQAADVYTMLWNLAHSCLFRRWEDDVWIAVRLHPTRKDAIWFMQYNRCAQYDETTEYTLHKPYINYDIYTDDGAYDDTEDIEIPKPAPLHGPCLTILHGEEHLRRYVCWIEDAYARHASGISELENMHGLQYFKAFFVPRDQIESPFAGEYYTFMHMRNAKILRKLAMSAADKRTGIIFLKREPFHAAVSTVDGQSKLQFLSVFHALYKIGNYLERQHKTLGKLQASTPNSITCFSLKAGEIHVDHYLRVPLQEVLVRPLAVDLKEPALSALRQFPRSAIMRCKFMRLDTTLVKQNQEVFYPAMLFFNLNAGRTQILTNYTMVCDLSSEGGQLIQGIAKEFALHHYVAKQIIVPDKRTEILLSAFCRAVGIPLVLNSKSCRALEKRAEQYLEEERARSEKYMQRTRRKHELQALLPSDWSSRLFQRKLLDEAQQKGEIDKFIRFQDYEAELRDIELEEEQEQDKQNAQEYTFTRLGYAIEPWEVEQQEYGAQCKAQYNFENAQRKRLENITNFLKKAVEAGAEEKAVAALKETAHVDLGAVSEFMRENASSEPDST